jgi:hypothetical protein
MEAKTAAREHYAGLALENAERARECWRNRSHDPTPGLNVVGIGIGEKYSDGRFTGQPCVTVYVAQKFSLRCADRAYLAPLQSSDRILTRTR